MVSRSIRAFCSHFGIACLPSRAWRSRFTEVFEIFALTSVLHSCFLELRADNLPKYSRFLLPLRYCFLAFLGLGLTVYRSIQAFCSHFGIAFLLSWVWKRRFTEVFMLCALTSVLHSCFLSLGADGLPKYSRFCTLLRYCFLAFMGLKAPVYRSIHALCSHFGIAVLFSRVWGWQFTEVFKLCALTSVFDLFWIHHFAGL